jgi:hypothetical protein
LGQVWKETRAALARQQYALVPVYLISEMRVPTAVKEGREAHFSVNKNGRMLIYQATEYRGSGPLMRKKNEPHC